MESARAAIRFENEIMAKNPDPEPLLTDWIHGVYLFSHLFANALKVFNNFTKNEKNYILKKIIYF
jgi:hypothetical protein